MKHRPYHTAFWDKHGISIMFTIFVASFLGIILSIGAIADATADTTVPCCECAECECVCHSSSPTTT